MSGRWTPEERFRVEHMMRFAVVGGSDTVRKGIEDFVAQTAADEVIMTANIYDHDARLASYSIIAEVCALESAG